MVVRKRFCTLILCLGCACPEALAAPPPSLEVQGPADACPSPRALIRELGQLLPQTRLASEPDGSGESVRIADLGDAFSVSVAGETRRFDDASRQCAERARLAAVFVALVLDPLNVPSEESNPPPPPPAPAQPPAEPEPTAAPPPAPAPAAANVDLELGPLLWVAASSTSANVPRAGGMAARLRWGGGLALSLGVAGLLPAHLEYERASVEAVWLPFDVSLRVGQRLDAWELGAELGPIAAWLSVAGQEVPEARSGSRLELGARLGASVRYWASPDIALVLSGHVASFPRPYRLELAGLGEVGRTPSLWIGTSIGAVIDFD